jgi:hypothetical protein
MNSNMHKIKFTLIVSAIKVISIFFLMLIISTSLKANSFPEIHGWWVSTGGTTGFTDKRFTYGGEISFLYIPDNTVTVFGIVTDFVHDNRLKSNRMMIGPEIAYFFFGMDGGLALNFNHGKAYKGYSVRPFITFPFFISPVLYFRRTHIYYEHTSKAVHEIGIQIKIALPLHKI